MHLLRRGRAFALLALTFFCLIAPPARASVDGVVTGVVEDAFLYPLAGVTVLVHDADGKRVASVVTGPDGKFVFPGITFGDYTVEANAPGLTGDHQHVRVSSSDTAALELVLTNSEEVISISEDWSVPEPARATGSVATVTRQQQIGRASCRERV